VAYFKLIIASKESSKENLKSPENTKIILRIIWNYIVFKNPLIFYNSFSKISKKCTDISGMKKF
jgi:hypothetical protein